MLREIIRPLAQTVLAATLAFAAVAPASPAQAASGRGASVSHDESCRDVRPNLGVILCSRVHVVMQEKTTPSGKQLLLINSRFTYTLTDVDGKLLYEDEGRSHFRSSSRDEMLESLSQRSWGKLETPTFSCTTKSAFKLVNDEVRFDRSEFNCTDS